MKEKIEAIIEKRSKEKEDNKHMIIYWTYLDKFIKDLKSLQEPIDEVVCDVCGMKKYACDCKF